MPALEAARPPLTARSLYISAYRKPRGEMAKRFLQKPFSIADLTRGGGAAFPGEAKAK